MTADVDATNCRYPLLRVEVQCCHLSQLPSGNWQVRYRDPARSQRKETFATRAEAQARLDEARTDVRRGRYVDPADGNETFSTFAERWARGRHWKGNTREGYPRVMKRLEELDPMSLVSIDRLVLEGVQTSLEGRYARRTVVLTMSYARAVMAAAYATGRIGRDPTLGLEGPPVRAGEPDGVVRPEDVPTSR